MTRALLFLTLLATGLTTAHAESFVLKPTAGDRLELRVHKTGVYSGKTHIFSVADYSGTLEYDPARPEASRIEWKFPAASLKLEDKWLNEKDFKEVQRYALEEMLDAKKYPEVSFTSRSIRATDATHFEVEGLLFLRGAGRPVLVKVVLDQSGGSTLKFSGSSTFKMTAWGLKPPKALLGLIGTKNEMDLTFRLTAQQ